MPSCYVATVVYDNENAPEVKALREIRDTSLQNNYFGRQFVKFYYSGAGEKIANFLKNNIPVAKPIIKKGLDYIIEKHDNSKN